MPQSTYHPDSDSDIEDVDDLIAAQESDDATGQLAFDLSFPPPFDAPDVSDEDYLFTYFPAATGFTSAFTPIDRFEVGYFLSYWRVKSATAGAGSEPHPRIRPVTEAFWTRKPTIEPEDVAMGRCDVQGIDWKALGTTREVARAVRSRFYLQRMAPPGTTSKMLSKAWLHLTGSYNLAPTESFCRFRRTACMDHWRACPTINHFQLRHLMAATSWNDVYYANRSSIVHKVPWDEVTAPQYVATLTGGEAPKITAVAALGDVVLAGGFEGEYVLRDVGTEHTPQCTGMVSTAANGITNHVHAFISRTGGTLQAAFCSNDQRLRILDCRTNRFAQDFAYDWPVNCSAMSASNRLRVVAGDHTAALITAADTGRPLVTLPGHTGFVFAADWADDDVHVATGAQDGRVLVWDARRWDAPVADLPPALGCPRSLRFSRVGAGPRVLALAEAEDVVALVDARGFARAQRLDCLGSVAGVDFAPGGDFFVANADPRFGGILHYERTGSEDWFVENTRGRGRHGRDRDPRDYPDWAPEDTREESPWESRRDLTRSRSGQVERLGDVIL